MSQKRISTMSRFKISITSSFREWWRYNIYALYELCDSEGNRIAYHPHDEHTAPVGSNFTAPPENAPQKCEIKMKTAEGDYINLLIYIIPHSLPLSRLVSDTPDFPLTVKVEAGKDVVLLRKFMVNQWSGINLFLDKLGAVK